jgi:Zn-dependent protease with chaperone function
MSTKNLISIASILWILLCSSAMAKGKFIEQKTVSQSPYYTGNKEAEQLQYKPAKEWLEQHTDKERQELVIRSQGFLIDDKRVGKEVTRIANRLLAQWPGKRPEINLFIGAQSSPLMYGASTSAAGEIFLRYGVLVQAESEDEVAAVIAHELSHVLLEHNKKLNYRKWAKETVDTVSEARELYSLANSMEYDKENRKINTDERAVSADLKKIASQSNVAEKFYASAHASMFSRSAEYEADILALDLMIAAGYAPRAMLITLERISHSYELANKVRKTLQEANRSFMDQQIKQLNAAIKTDDPEQLKSDTAISETLGKLEKQGIALSVGWLSRSHPNTDKRMTKVSDYLYSNYNRKVRRRRLDHNSMDAFRTGYNGAVIQNIAAASQSLSSLFADDLSDAEKLAKQAISGPTAENAFSRYAAYSVRSAQGKTKLALLNLEKMNTDDWIPIDESMELANVYLTEKKFPQAWKLIETQEGYFGEIDSFFPLKIKLALATKQMEKATDTASRCYKKHKIDNKIANQCAQLAGLDVKKKKSNPFGGLGSMLNKISSQDTRTTAVAQ